MVAPCLGATTQVCMADTSPTRHEPAALYAAYFETLVAIAVDEYEISKSVAVKLADAVMLSYLRKRDVDDIRTWLLAAMTWASRTYVERNVQAIH